MGMLWTGKLCVQSYPMKLSRNATNLIYPGTKYSEPRSKVFEIKRCTSEKVRNRIVHQDALVNEVLSMMGNHLALTFTV